MQHIGYGVVHTDSRDSGKQVFCYRSTLQENISFDLY